VFMVYRDCARFDNVNSSGKKLLKDAKTADLRWHDMRNRFASRLALGLLILPPSVSSWAIAIMA